jgi:HEAT repeat protein
MQLLGLVAAISSCAQMTGPGVRERAASAPSRAAYDAMLDELIPGMGAENIVDRETPQQTFEDLCLHAARSGAEAERVALCRAVVSRLGPETPKPARIWMLRQLAHVGGNESVTRLAELLSDADPRIRELSRRALQNIPSTAAAGALCWALEYADDSDWRVALINAIAAHPKAPAYIDLMGRGAGGSTYTTLGELAGGGDDAVAFASITALAELGGPTAVETLHAVWRGGWPARADAAATGLIRVAERRLYEGEPDVAEEIFAEMYGSHVTPELHVAALHGLVAIRGADALPLLLELVTGDDPYLAATAARFAEGIPGQAVTARLVEAFRGASPVAQVLLLGTLAARGDMAAHPTVVTAVASPDERVRIAALGALRDLGDDSTVLLLAQAAAVGSDKERAVARESLTRLRDGDVDAAILAGIEEHADAAVRCELIRSTAARWYRPAIPTLFAASKDPAEAVRVAALRALGDLALENHLPELVQRLIDVAGDEARQAAEDAVVKTALRIEEAEQRAGPVLAALEGASGNAKASLVRVLGRIGGPRALEAIRAARLSVEGEVVDAAVRALANWPDPEVLDDLLDIARSSLDQTHAVLALRGYVRLVRLPSERPPLETFEMLEKVMPLAQRPDERKLVLSALADVRHVSALQTAESLLDDETLRDEAGVTTLAIARALAAEEPEAARAAIEKVRAAPVSEKVRQQADQTADFLRRFEGYSAAWLLAGPYVREGENAAALFDLAFPPETSGAADVEWRRLLVNNPANPWIFDLAGAVGGENRCVYVRTSVWSEQQQTVRLEIGSDDGVRAWLNGELVHSNLVYRGITPAEDKVPVTLKSGWNTLMLKIVQGGGAWGFCAGFRTLDGDALEGLKFKPE